MSLRIGHKLFLAFLLTTAAVVIFMVLAQRYSFQRGFLDYVNGIESGQLDRIALQLEEYYAEAGGWQAAAEEHWLRRLIGHAITLRRGRGDRPPPHAAGPQRPDHSDTRDRPPPRDRGGRVEHTDSPSPIFTRLGLWDVQGNWISGAKTPTPAAVRRDLFVEGRAIGHLLLDPVDRLSAGLDLQFAQQQRSGLYLAALAVFLAAAAAASILARSLVAPIARLTDGTHALTRGKYATRLETRGSDELSRLATDFNALAETLEENREARQRWAADISHELRTPLTILKGELEALQDGLRPVDAAALQSLSAEVERLNKLVNDLYALTSSDSGGLHFEQRPVDVQTLLEATVERFRERCDASKLKVELASAGEHVVRGDAERLRQLLANLLENSLRYTTAGGTVRIAQKREREIVRITVEDSAPGVPDEALPRLFERLYRVDPSRSRETGAAGLGLAICANIARGHGGRISARHSPLGGLAIDVDLPVYNDE